MIVPRLTEPTNAYEFLTKWLPTNVFLPEPKRLRMGDWYERDLSWHFEENKLTREQAPPCGTIGCIGGFTETCTGGDFSRDAHQILGLDPAQGEELFYDETLMYAPNQGTPEHVADVIAHINRFAAKYEEQLKGHMVIPA